MAFKDLTQYLVKDLEIPLGGKTYLVPPPTKENGLILASFIALGFNASRGKDSSEEDINRVQEHADTNLAAITLGPVLDQMRSDGVPEAHIDQAAIYTMYYWTMGEEAADAVFQVLYSVAVEGDVPKALLPLKIGRSTALENLTKTASTNGTGSRPATSDHKPPTSKKAGSRGNKHSKTGRSSSKTSPSTTPSTGAPQPSTGQPLGTSS